jgi:hypothetical protein
MAVHNGKNLGGSFEFLAPAAGLSRDVRFRFHESGKGSSTIMNWLNGLRNKRLRALDQVNTSVGLTDAP